ncbi:MAG: MFS transporter [Anaerolineales bacterium]|nr:MFS transporter [Anaerolineales bacterium]
MQTNSRKNLLILAFALIVVMLGFGMVIPIFPFYIERLGASGGQYGVLIAIYAIMQFLFAPLWGGLSDRVGRKPVLMVGILGNGLTLLMFGLANQLWVLYFARLLSGLLASATMPAAMAYIGDSTSEQERGGGIGQLGAAAALGLILGPGLGGWLAGDSLSLPFFIAAGFSLASLLLIALLLPESLPAAARQPAAGKLKMVALGELWRALFGPIGVLLLMAFLVSFAATNFQVIFGLYALKKFDFDPVQVGTVLAITGLVSALIQGALTGPLTKRWDEMLLIKVFLLTNALGFLVLLLAYDYMSVLLTTGIYVLSHTLLRPVVQSLTSKRANLGQGSAMGLNNAFISLGQIVGPLWAGVALDIHVDLPYLSGAAILFIGFVISLFTLSQRRSDAKVTHQVIL